MRGQRPGLWSRYLESSDIYGDEVGKVARRWVGNRREVQVGKMSSISPSRDSLGHLLGRPLCLAWTWGMDQQGSRQSPHPQTPGSDD